MAQIIIRNLDDAVVERLKARARGSGRSLEAEVKHVLEQSAKVDMATVGSMLWRYERSCREGSFRILSS